MMGWLEAAVGLIVAALVLVRWLGSHMRLIWRYGPGRRAAVTATATLVRALPSARPLAIEPPRQGAQEPPGYRHWLPLSEDAGPEQLSGPGTRWSSVNPRGH